MTWCELLWVGRCLNVWVRLKLESTSVYWIKKCIDHSFIFAAMHNNVLKKNVNWNKMFENSRGSLRLGLPRFRIGWVCLALLNTSFYGKFFFAEDGNGGGHSQPRSIHKHTSAHSFKSCLPSHQFVYVGYTYLQRYVTTGAAELIPTNKVGMWHQNEKRKG